MIQLYTGSQFCFINLLQLGFNKLANGKDLPYLKIYLKAWEHA